MPTAGFPVTSKITSIPGDAIIAAESEVMTVLSCLRPSAMRC